MAVEVTNPVLTDDERKELEALRAEKAAAPAGDNSIAGDKASITLPPTHWLWLANGTVIESNGVKSSHDGIPVVFHFAKPQEMVTPPVAAHVF